HARAKEVVVLLAEGCCGSRQDHGAGCVPRRLGVDPGFDGAGQREYFCPVAPQVFGRIVADVLGHGLLPVVGAARLALLDAPAAPTVPAGAHEAAELVRAAELTERAALVWARAADFALVVTGCHCIGLTIVGDVHRILSFRSTVEGPDCPSR